MKKRKPGVRARGGASFLCTMCSAPTKVRRTIRRYGGHVTRQRYCPRCGNTFTTLERVENRKSVRRK